MEWVRQNRAVASSFVGLAAWYAGAVLLHHTVEGVIAPGTEVQAAAMFAFLVPHSAVSHELAAKGLQLKPNDPKLLRYLNIAFSVALISDGLNLFWLPNGGAYNLPQHALHGAASILLYAAGTQVLYSVWRTWGGDDEKKSK